MSEPITDYYVVEFASPADAERVANYIADTSVAQGRQMRQGALRPVIWTSSPLAPKGALFLSVGALELAREVGIELRPMRRISAEELPAHRTLLMGEPGDRW
ncbi:MAG TPA: hypothetical protein VEI47_06260 [Gemmatimonadales bacterium]|jgi:hypothetical protein|nr:hypothetical protein [Gemmatimonadales bacterium]